MEDRYTIFLPGPNNASVMINTRPSSSFMLEMKYSSSDTCLAVMGCPAFAKDMFSKASPVQIGSSYFDPRGRQFDCLEPADGAQVKTIAVKADSKNVTACFSMDGLTCQDLELVCCIILTGGEYWPFFLLTGGTPTLSCSGITGSENPDS
jgi:hypothetical protein